MTTTTPAPLAFNTDLTASIPERLVTQTNAQRDEICAHASGLAAEDVASGIGPETPGPTNGELQLFARVETDRASAESDGATCKREATARVDGIKVTLEADKSGEQITDGSARRRVMKQGLVLVGLAALPETLALRSPAATALRLEQGSLKNWLIAGLMGYGAAIFAAAAGEFGVASIPGRWVGHRGGPALRRRARFGAVVSLSFLTLVAAFAASTRISALRTESGFTGFALTSGEMASIILAQAIFVAVALTIGVGAAIISRRSEMKAQERQVRDIEEERDGLLRLLAEMPSLVGRRIAAVHAAGHAALLEYRSTLVLATVRHDPEAATRWEARFAATPTPFSGSTRLTIVPDVPDDPDDPATATAAEDDPDPDNDIDLRDTNADHTAEQPDDDEAAHTEQAVDDPVDLFAAIVEPPAQ